MEQKQKIQKATDILKSCIGNEGIWADPTRYRYQCWTRDLVIAVLPALVDIGETDIIKKHLENLSTRQRANGQIPILFLDETLKWLIIKAKKGLREGKIPFMIRRFFAGGVWNLTPGTKDSEILYTIGMYEYADRTGDRSLLEKYQENIDKAFAYIESTNLVDGLAIGCDWRDTMEKQLADEPLLTNNCLLYHAYVLAGEKSKAQKLREKINSFFWKGNSYMDYPGEMRFDPLGGAFAVLYGVADKEKYGDIIKSYHSVDTKNGVTIKCKHNPFTAEEKEVIERTDGIVVWPFIVGFSVLAINEMGDHSFAKEQLDKMFSLSGFYEWYDPANGKGYGALEQLWSATLLLRASKILKIG